jgi:hypothetical protein
MATYVEALKGYVADVPKVIFKRCDGRKFLFDELTAATVTPQMNPMEVNAGWSLFPVAVLPGQSTFEMSITSGKFDAELFSMANATEYKLMDGSDTDHPKYAMPTAERHEIDANHQITLIETPIEDSVSIKGMTEVDANPTAGQFVVDATTKKITFNDAEDGTIEVIYDYEKEVYEAIIDNKSSAIGEASCIWPVYGSGDDCSESAIVGYYIVKVFRARITTVPGMDTSYKSAATFQFTLSALDAKRNDEGAYSTAYFKKGSQNG